MEFLLLSLWLFLINGNIAVEPDTTILLDNKTSIIEQIDDKYSAIQPIIFSTPTTQVNDAIKVLFTPKVIHSPHLDITIEYISEFSNELHLQYFYETTFGKEIRFHKMQFPIQCPLRETCSLAFEIVIPDHLIYFDEQNADVPTNYFVSELKITSFLAVSNESTEVIVLHNTSSVIYLPSPWYRKDRPRYCKNWWLSLKKQLMWKTVPICPLLADPTLFSSVLPLAGNEGRYTRKLSPLNWPKHSFSHIQDIVNPVKRFTLLFSVFIMEDCSSGICMILQRRNSSTFFTPLIIWNSQRQFHVQLHTEDGKGNAFTSIDRLPLQTWIHAALVVHVNIADLYIMHQGQASIKHYSHIGTKEYFMNFTDGIWVAGGYAGTNSFQGYISQVQLYENQNIQMQHIFHYLKGDKLAAMGLQSYYKKCGLMKQYTWNYILKNPSSKASCPVLCWWQNPLLQPSKTATCPLIQQKIRIILKQEAEVVGALKNFSTEASTIRKFGKHIYEQTEKQMLREALTKSLALRLFQVSGCFGYSKGYHMSATMLKYGLGVPVEPKKSVFHHLLGCQQNSPLSQLALAYRYQLGADDLPKDIDAMTSLLRQAAITVITMVEKEDHIVHTHSEMIRLDQAHSFGSVRGSDSELFKWLSQQAKMGSTDAMTKVAEMLFHGKQGVAVNQHQALEYYEIAADAGDPNAIYNMGVLHMKGAGVEKNETKAFEYFRRSTGYNSSLAYNSLGYMELVHNKNRSGAAYYWKVSAELDNPEGMTNYASLLETGITSVNQSDKLAAFELYKKAAAIGQKHACIRAADTLIEGSLVDRDLKSASQYLRFVAEQVTDIGICMRNAIDSYVKDQWYKSLLYHLLATEAGLQLAGYNTALLLDEYKGMMQQQIILSDSSYYLNLTAELGFSLALVAMGHQNWLKNDVKTASHYYAKSVAKDNNAEALFNLAYIIEHNHVISEQIRFPQYGISGPLNGNLTLASLLYKNCRDSLNENNEGYYPCQLAYLKVLVKCFLNSTNQMALYVTAGIALLILIYAVTLLKNELNL